MTCGQLLELTSPTKTASEDCLSPDAVMAADCWLLRRAPARRSGCSASSVFKSAGVGKSASAAHTGRRFGTAESPTPLRCESPHRRIACNRGSIRGRLRCCEIARFEHTRAVETQHGQPARTHRTHLLSARTLSMRRREDGRSGICARPTGLPSVRLTRTYGQPNNRNGWMGVSSKVGASGGDLHRGGVLSPQL
jgi:hypothetical protein